MVDRPPTEKELAEILAKFRRAGGGQIMTGGALNKLAEEFGLEKKRARGRRRRGRDGLKRHLKRCRSDSRGSLLWRSDSRGKKMCHDLHFALLPAVRRTDLFARPVLHLFHRWPTANIAEQRFNRGRINAGSGACR